MTRSRDLLRRALALYNASPRADRLFVRARAFLSDLPQIQYGAMYSDSDGTIYALSLIHI